MRTDDPVILRQLRAIQKIIEDETWLEGERRGCSVSPNDGAVRENVCRVVLAIGGEMRAAAAQACAEGGDRGAPAECPRPPEAAPAGLGWQIVAA